MSYYLFLDDIRYPSDVTWVNIPNYEWTIARDFFQFRDIIKIKGVPSFVCYDHDLGAQHYRDLKIILETHKIDYSKYKEKTGYDCAKYLVEFCQDQKLAHPPYEIHSMNPVGAENIKKYIDNYNATRI